MRAASVARAASAALAVSAALLLAACSAGAPGPGIDVDRALGHTAALVALGPRPGDSPAAARGADYIARSLEELGLAVERAPVGTVDLAEIRALGRTFRKPRTAVTRDPNLIVRIGGPGPALLVLAHYDTVRGSPGAVDNAAAAGVLIELARALRDAPPPAPVVLAFPANEEIGLVGSEALAASASAGPAGSAGSAGPAGDIAFAIALDLVGGTGPLSLNGAGAQIRRPELGWLADAAGRAGVALRAPLPHRVISRWWPQLERSDHGPFTRRGIRAVHLYHRGQDGELIDLAYHSARDTLARVDRGAVDELGRLLRALAASAPPAPDGDSTDGFWVPVAINTVVPRWALLALELALAGAALALLAWPARLATPGPRPRRRLGAIALALCYAAATAAALGVERMTAGDHPAPWLHAPGSSVLALALVLAGALVLATRLAARLATWTGEHRYLALAAGVPLATGAGLLAAGAAELAWIWLVPAAALALAPRLPRVRWIALAAAALPAALILAPAQLREAAWNRFLPPGLPLAALISITSLPVAAAGAWLARTRGPAGLRAGPLGTVVLTVGSALAILVGAVMLVRHDPPCTPRQFQEIHLACEASPELP